MGTDSHRHRLGLSGQEGRQHLRVGRLVRREISGAKLSHYKSYDSVV